jgi:dihydroorotate dehydrogenase
MTTSKAVHGSLVPASFEQNEISLLNSFGVPSLPVREWVEDVESAKNSLGDGQILIVSVMGSGDDPETQAAGDDELIRQFARTAALAQEAGADIIEINLSCPNTGGNIICTSPELSARIAREVHKELARSRTPLLIKISYLRRSDLEALIAACAPYIDGIVAINSVMVPAVFRNNNDVSLFPGRTHAGLSGAAIRNLGVQTVQWLAELRESHKASHWVIVGVGGVVSANDYTEYRAAGADAVQSCSGAWMNPRLAWDIQETLFGRPLSVFRTLGRGLDAVLEAIDTGGASVITRPGQGSSRVGSSFAARRR